jgi:AhpD family alkylhydroperoxidase
MSRRRPATGARRAFAVARFSAGFACAAAVAAAGVGAAAVLVAPPAAVAAGPAEARMPLAPADAAAIAAIPADTLLEPAGASGRVPNYLRALAATHPKAAPAFARLFKTVLYGGTLPPATKIAMGRRIARAHGNTYVDAHLARLLPGAAPADADTPAGRLALRYADNLTRAIHGVSDADFAEIRKHFNDAQIVELTITVCFFNYFDRLTQGLALPVESWVRDAGARPSPPPARPEANPARVALISDAEVQAVARAAAPPPPASPSGGLGIGLANSRRAMLRVPDMADAWFGYWAAVREDTRVDRPTQLQVSFAVSMANGCRYCVLHQVLGLRRAGVDMAKLVAMKKDDSALTAAERAAVVFARKLTREPAAVTDADFAALQAAFPGAAAADIVLQTCAFNFMNRFTDGLRLPSEDEAIKTYHEVYGTSFEAEQRTAAAAPPPAPGG